MQKAGEEQKFSTDYSDDERATSMELDVLLQNRGSGVFRDGVVPHEVDGMLSVLCSEPNCKVGDRERLQCFRGLKALADPQYLDKFKLLLVSDRKGNTWRYEFSLGDRYHYASEARLIGNEQDLNEYESEYFLQAFPNTVNREEINTAILAVCYGVGDEAPSNSQRLESFQVLATYVPLEKAGLFESNVSLDNDNKKWTYQFLIDGVRLYGSEPIDLDQVNDLALFENAILLQRFHKLVREADWGPDVLSELAGLREKLLPIEQTDFGVQAFLAAKFESMARVACAFHKEASIDVHGPIFCLKIDGAELYDGKIPPAAPENDRVTPRVQITMSALRVSILSIEPAYTTLMNELDNYRLSRQGIGATDELSLRDALSNDSDGIREIRTRCLNGPAGTSSWYELGVTFESGKKGTFSRYENGTKDVATLISAFSTLSLDSRALAASTEIYGKKLLQGLFFPVRIQVYLESLLFMSQKESNALHEAMRNTVFLNDVSLGEIFNIPAREPT